MLIRGAQLVIAVLAVFMVTSLALSSLVLAVALAGLLVVAIVALVLGTARAATVFIALGFATVVFDDVHLLAGAGPSVADPFFLAGFALLVPHFLRTSLRLPTPFVVGAAGLVTIGTLSALATDHPEQNLNYLVNVVRGVVLLPVLVTWWGPRRKEVMALAFAYVLGNGLNVIASLLEGPAASDRYDGWSSHPNVLAYGQALSLALVPFLLATVPRRHRWIVGLLAAVSAYGIWLSGSRAALACAVALTLMYPVFTRSVRVGLGIAALSTPAIVVLGYNIVNIPDSSPLGRLLGDPTGQESNDARREGAQAGIDQLQAHPFLGDGWLTVWGAHIAYLQIPAAIGLFGLAFYLLLLSSLLRPLVKVPLPYGLLAVPALAAAALDLVLPVVGAALVWCVLGLALCAAGLAACEDDHPPGAQVEDPADAPEPVDAHRPRGSHR